MSAFSLYLDRFRNLIRSSRPRLAMDRAKLTETDIITKFILPAIDKAGCNSTTQLRQEVKLREGKVIVRGQ